MEMEAEFSLAEWRGNRWGFRRGFWKRWSLGCGRPMERCGVMVLIVIAGEK